MTEKQVWRRVLTARRQIQDRGDRNCCAVYSVAVLSGLSFFRVSRQFEKLGRRLGRRTPHWMTDAVIEAIGCKLTLLPRLANTIIGLEKLDTGDDRYLIETAGHHVPFVRGRARDHTSCRKFIIKRMYLFTEVKNV